MISLDQVYLLEEKVESAVAKIQQLQAENDALRNKCAELTNALSAKSEQLTTIETDQDQIESGIKKALDRLNSIENSVLKTVSKMEMGGQVASTPHQSVRQTLIHEENPKQVTENKASQESFTTREDSLKEEVSPSFATMTQMFDDKSPAQRPNPQTSIPETQFTEGTEEEVNVNPLMNPFMQYDDSNGASDDNFQEDIPDEEEDGQEDDLGFDIF